MPDTNSHSASDEIVLRGREERAQKRAQGLDPTEEIPKLSLTTKTQKETREQYLRRCSEHKIPRKFAG
ncbi:MAG: hypothetical protein P1P90_06360 [Patescibacteria group bacterium]|nr:hypothetical protein [Patescibacteria group bacterium]